MDLDPHFGRFFVKLEFLKSLRVQKCVLPHEVWTPKIVIFPVENAIFYKINVFCFEVEIDGKHEKNETQSLQNQCLLWRRFLNDFWANLVGFWASSWAPKVPVHPGFFARCVQEAPKRLLRAPRVPQERPKRLPRASPKRPRAPKSVSRAIEIAQNHASRPKSLKIR